MKIRMLTCLASADATVNAGQVIERDNAEAQRLIAAGFATPVNPDDAALETPEPPEQLETPEGADGANVEQLETPEGADAQGADEVRADSEQDETDADSSTAEPPAEQPAPKPRRKRRSKKQ